VQAHYFLAVCLFFEAEAMREAGQDRKARPLYAEAAEEGGRAAKLKPDHALAMAFRGRALARIGETKSALESLRAARDSRPDLYETHFQLGDALASAGQWNEALPHLETAARLANGRDPKVEERLEEARRQVPKKAP